MKTRNEVLDMVRGKLRLLHFSLRTEDAYCHWIGRYYDFCRSKPRGETREARAEAFLTSLARAWLSAKSQNQALSALLFLYKHVLKTPLGDIDALRAKRPPVERVAPSREQVRSFRDTVTDTPHTPARLLVDLIYGCGLRVCEPLDLRIRDILWGENQLVIRAAKGGKDRRVPVPTSCIEPLRRQVECARRTWEEDHRAAPIIGVPLPWRLAFKYPNAATSWEWFWLFPAPGHCRDPLTRETVRFRLLEDSLQRAVHEASVRAGLGHLISPHVLRHAYATHSREPIEKLRQLMGHASIETTAGYRHVTVEQATNPLDDLMSELPLNSSPTASPGEFRTPKSSDSEFTHDGRSGANPRTTGFPVVPEWLRGRSTVRWKNRPLFRLVEAPAAAR